MNRGGLRIDNLWGTGGGQRPVNQLIKEVRGTKFDSRLGGKSPVLNLLPFLHVDKRFSQYPLALKWIVFTATML